MDYEKNKNSYLYKYKINEQYKWIKNSKFYLSLLKDDPEITFEEIIENTPKEFLCYLPFPENYDILKMIKIINYWDIILPECYLLLNTFSEKNKVILIEELKSAPEGYTEIIKHFIDFLNQNEYHLITWCTRNDNLECLIYIDKYSSSFLEELYKIQINEYTFAEAAQHGSLKCLKFLNKRFPNIWDEKVTLRASEYGHLNCLMYAIENECKANSSCSYHAILNGHLECLIYLCKNFNTPDIETINSSVRYNKLECLIYLHSIKYPWNKSTTLCAGVYGNFKILKYLHENGCPWNIKLKNRLEFNINYNIVKEGSIKCLNYYFENGGV